MISLKKRNRYKIPLATLRIRFRTEQRDFNKSLSKMIIDSNMPEFFKSMQGRIMPITRGVTLRMTRSEKLRVQSDIDSNEENKE